MSRFNKLEITPELIKDMSGWLKSQGALVPVNANDTSSLLVCYSILRELGGLNDELAQFIYDDAQGRPVDRRALSGEIGFLDGDYCIRISSALSQKISISIPWLQELAQCRGEDILISPAKIASKIRFKGLAPVIVRDWLNRAIFSDFDPKKMSYRDQLWVLRNNEVMLYSEIVASDKIIFQDLHDITAHIAGLNYDGYRFAGNVAAHVHQKLKSYFGPSGRGNLTSQLVPFLIGVILDGLTQSMIYYSENRRMAIEELLSSMDSLGIDPQSKLLLKGFPKGIDVINGILQQKTQFSLAKLKAEIKSLLEESVQLTSNLSIAKLEGAVQ